ncbi:Caspase recruitment domain-containing protein 14 [Acipenser ruthenus]|uniref:Caspase recruitment domain-containing protein 14 n=1 Tax=Acipenser ruthenus TaxID=7906 RepID=A0A444UQI2_ACIRT|nr:Caspase recruitment domain-containing protein 14 [Acipenser ruthenus]
MAGGVDLSGKELNDLDEEELWELINNHRDKITLGVKPCMLTAYLRQACVLSDLDEEEILHCPKNINRCMRTGYMLDILKTRGKNGAIAFLESLMIHFPKLYTQVTGKEPTMEHSSGVMKHSELTEYLVKAMTEMQQVQSQEKSKALLMENRCFQLEAELTEAKRRVEELGNLDAEFKRLQREFNLRYQELLRVKDEKCNLCMRYTSAVEESSLMASRCRDLQLESESEFERKKSVDLRRRSEAVELKEEIESLNHKLLQFDPAREDILVQNLVEEQDSKLELMEQIQSLREEAEKAMCERDEHFEEKEALLLECQKLRLDCEMYQEKTAAFQVQLRELQKERDQAYLARDEAQSGISQSLSEKDSMRLQVMELQGQIFELRKQATQMKGQMERQERPILILPNILGHLLNERLQEYQEFQLCQSELLSDSEFAERLKLGDILGVKERQNTYNCYTKQAVEAIMEKNAHCLLEVELDCVRRMHKAEIFPIIIFIVTSEKSARKLRKKLQKQGSSEEHLLECYKAAETLLDKLPCLTRTISSETWSDMESLISCVKAAVAKEQKKIVWIEQDLR